MNIKDLQNKDRPRERLMSIGPRALSDVELLSILIGSGTKDRTVFDIASNILQIYTLPQLKDITYTKLIEFKGINQAKACQLLSCFELARRGSQKEVDKKSLETAEAIYKYIYDEIYLQSTEIIIAILVDCKLKPIKKIVDHSSDSFQIIIPVKKIVSEALAGQAYGLILVHNHPSGEVTASKADITATLQLKQILYSLDILLLEHLVVCPTAYYSMASHGLLSSSLEYNELGDFLEKINY
ncbi:MAG: DNA repair protein RadC [Anaeroplasmataceae bacterium]|nr:DNA repair protein RadC [Anaeroplasmataceae bacterium]